MVTRGKKHIPYVGPRPFERNEWDRERFFGRDRETNEIISLIFSQPLVLVYAQSGAGKTSLFNAQIAPELAEMGFEILPLARVGRASSMGFEAENIYVFNALQSLTPGEDPQALMDQSLTAFLSPDEHPHLLDDNGDPVPRAVVFDQFEEMFTLLPERWSEQQAVFFGQVAEALRSDPLLRIVFVMREDYIAQLDPYTSLVPDKLRARFRLERLRQAAALEAIVRPLQPTGYAFASGVAERLVEELLKIQVQRASGQVASVRGEFVEPVQLQIVCQSLWEKLPEKDKEIGQSHVEKLGNVTEALSRFYEQCIQTTASKTGVSESKLHAWFQETMITSAGTRGIVFRDQARDIAGTESMNIPGKAVDVLEDLHLIRGEERAGARWYELTHDRFIQPILQVFEANTHAAMRLARFERRQKTANWIGFPLLFVLLPLLAGFYATGVLLPVSGLLETAVDAFHGFWPLGQWPSAAYVVLLIVSVRWLVEALLHAVNLETEEINIQGILLQAVLFIALLLLWMWTFAGYFTWWSAALCALAYLLTILLASQIAVKTLGVKLLARWSGIALLFGLASVLAALVVERDPFPSLPTELVGIADASAHWGPLVPWLGILVGVGIIVLFRFVVQAVIDPLIHGAHDVTFLDVLLQAIVFSPLALLWLRTFRAGMEAQPDWAALFGLGYVASTLLASAIAIRLAKFVAFARVVALLVLAGLVSALAALFVRTDLYKTSREIFVGLGPFWGWLSGLLGVGIILALRDIVQFGRSLSSGDSDGLTPLDVLLQMILFSPLALLWLWTFGAGIEALDGALFGFGYVATTVLSSLLATRVRRRY